MDSRALFVGSFANELRRKQGALSTPLRLSYVLAVSLLLGTVADAQQSTRARGYANAVSSELGQRRVAPTPIQGDHYRGISLQFDGLSIKRLRFSTAAEALEYAGTHGFESAGEVPAVIEVRGRQVVVLTGPLVRTDLRFTKRALSAGWHYLNNRDHETALMAVVLGGGRFAAWNPSNSGPLHGAIANAITSAQDLPEGVTSVGDAFIFADSGVVSAFRQTDSGGVFGLAPNSEQLSEVSTRLETLAGRSVGLTRALLQAPAVEAAARDGTGRRDRPALRYGDWSDDFETWSED